MHGMEMYGRTSRFLSEIPRELLREIRPRAETPAFGLGQRVSHAQFGEGVVVDYEGSGTHTRVQVNFENAGQKWLVLAFANLAKVE